MKTERERRGTAYNFCFRFFDGVILRWIGVKLVEKGWNDVKICECGFEFWIGDERLAKNVFCILIFFMNLCIITFYENKAWKNYCNKFIFV